MLFFVYTNRTNKHCFGFLSLNRCRQWWSHLIAIQTRRYNWILDCRYLEVVHRWESMFFSSNECLLNGSSGGPFLLDDFRTATAVDRKGNEWTFTEYSEIHSGGEYVGWQPLTILFFDLQKALINLFVFYIFRCHVGNVYQRNRSNVYGIKTSITSWIYHTVKHAVIIPTNENLSSITSLSRCITSGVTRIWSWGGLSAGNFQKTFRNTTISYYSF